MCLFKSRSIPNKLDAKLDEKAIKLGNANPRLLPTLKQTQFLTTQSWKNQADNYDIQKRSIR